MVKEKRPRMRIFKKYVLTAKGNYRWYSPDLDPEYHLQLNNPLRDRKQLPPKPKVPVISLDKHPEIQTEKDMVKFIYNNWGPGEYAVYGHKFGISGTWTFWRGHIDEEGFIFFKSRLPKEYSKELSEVEKEKKEAKQEGDVDEAKELESEEQEIKQEAREKKKRQRFGFRPWLKPSSIRGQKKGWEELEIDSEPLESPFESEEKSKNQSFDNESEISQEISKISKEKKEKSPFEMH